MDEVHANPYIGADPYPAAPVLYVSPTGDPANTGLTADSPWSLSYAASLSSRTLAGKRIELAGGTYAVSADLDLVASGSLAAPIVWAPAAGQKATIADNRPNSGTATLIVSGDYVTVRDLVVTNTATDRSGVRPSGIHLAGVGSKAINCVTTDGGVAIESQSGNAGGEIYGCITLNQGYEADATDRGHGHSIYLQNTTGVIKKVRRNIFGPGYGWNIHCYSATQDLKDFAWEANAAAFGGLLAGETGSGGFSIIRYGSIIGGGGASARHTITRHYGAEGTWDISYLAGGFDTLTMSGVIRGTSGEADWTSLTDTSTHPSGDAIYIEANEYETGRANVVVYNSALASTVAVDLSSVLNPGDTFGIFDGFNPLGAPLVTGTYAGGTVNVTMPTAFAVPVGGWRWGSAPARSKAFGVFVVRKTATWVAPA